MDNIFKLDFKTFLKSPNTYLFFLSLVVLSFVSNQLLNEKDKQILQLQQDKQIEINNLMNCNTELERRNKILEEIVFNKKIKEDGN
jgi:hypothetical protein